MNTKNKMKKKTFKQNKMQSNHFNLYKRMMKKVNIKKINNPKKKDKICF